MLRTLLWVEFCSTWWWWFLVLLPFAVTRQITSLTPHDLIDVNLNLLMPVVAGLGIASGLRDRQGVRAALVRHGTPGRVLMAKLLVPAILMPIYYFIGQAISREISERAVHVGSLYSVPEGNPLILVPIFCSGVATGLRQARWWATRFAPLAAVATLSILANALQPWSWIWDISGSRWDDVLFNLTVMQVIIAVLITAPCVWWCFAATREANGEDGPSSRTAMAWCIGMAVCGLFMAPWLFIADRWEYMLEHRTVTTAGPHPIEYAQPVFPALSVSKLVTSSDRWPNYRVSTMVEEYLLGGSLPGGGSIDYDWRNKRVRRMKDGVATQIPVLIRGTDGMDGTMPLDEAWSRLQLSLGQCLMDRWRNLEVGFSFGQSGRIIQDLDQRLKGDTGSREDRIYWTVTDDPALVRLHRGVGAPSRLFQVDTWSGPTVVLRPLTKDDPPFLRLFSHDRRLGIWGDHMSWTEGSHDPVQIPHPCTSAMPVHIEFQGDEGTVTIDYHWHPSPWSAHRRQIAIVARDGTILSRCDIPTADGNVLVQGLGLVGSPAIAALGLGLFDRTAAENTFRPWASPTVVPWAAAGGFLSMALTWLVLAHRGMARRSRWRWLAMALLGGMAVPVAALAVWYPSPRRACPSCGHRRWTDDRTCPACGSGWGLPPGDDRDIGTSRACIQSA